MRRKQRLAINSAPAVDSEATYPAGGAPQTSCADIVDKSCALSVPQVRLLDATEYDDCSCHADHDDRLLPRLRCFSGEL